MPPAFLPALGDSDDGEVALRPRVSGVAGSDSLQESCRLSRSGMRPNSLVLFREAHLSW